LKCTLLRFSALELLDSNFIQYWSTRSAVMVSYVFIATDLISTLEALNSSESRIAHL